jgi:hypothetical protein
MAFLENLPEKKTPPVSPCAAALAPIAFPRIRLPGIPVPLHVLPLHGHGPARAAMSCIRNSERGWGWLALCVEREGRLIGLNLAGQGLTNAAWQKIQDNNDLSDLEALNLRGNQLTGVADLSGMPRLRYADLCDNQLKGLKVPDAPALEHIFLAGNKDMDTPPPEIVAQGRFAIAGYFRDIVEQGTEKLFEAKLVLVGDGGAGKTTLREKLVDPNAPLRPPGVGSTKGIDIDKFGFPGNAGQPFQVNIWDFAGQDKYQPIHQFFYTHRALYVLVENSREQKTDFDQWLQMLQICSDGSPVLLVHNEFSDQAWNNFPFEDLQRKYPFLKDEFRVNFATGRGLTELRQAVEYHIQRLPQVGEALPKKWASIRTGLCNRSVETPFLSWGEFLAYCTGKPHELPTEDAERLSAYLHILGAMLHYADNDLLRQYVILQNEWATEAVYRILEDEHIAFDTRGRFTADDLARIWTRPDWKNMRPQLLELMNKFKLCYQIKQEKNYIAPQLLSSAPPAGYRWQPAADLQLEIRYPIMPRGLLTRFTVTRHTDIADGQTLVWSEGVVLEWHQTRAEVTEYYKDKKIKIRIQGNDRKGLLSIIDKTFDDLHGEFEGLKSVPPEKWIPCNCPQCVGSEKPHSYKYEALLSFKAHKRYTVACDKPPHAEVNIVQLIEDVLTAETSGMPPASVSKTIPNKEQIQDLIRMGELEEALELLPKDLDWAIQLNANYRQLKDLFLKELLTPQEFLTKTPKISNSLLEFLKGA